MTNLVDSTKRPPLPDGPWTSEPDHAEFEHVGFPCIIHRNGWGAWCGYVGVPPGHPWHGQNFMHVDVRIHGGLTYGQACQGDICHVPKPGESDDVFWLGFDCGHYNDLVPGMGEHRLPHWDKLPPSEYRDQGYVTNETRILAEQARVAAG